MVVSEYEFLHVNNNYLCFQPRQVFNGRISNISKTNVKFFSFLLQLTLAELDSIKDDFNILIEHQHDVVDMSNEDGTKIVKSTVAMLKDQLDQLQTMADDRGNKLHVSCFGS